MTMSSPTTASNANISIASRSDPIDCFYVGENMLVIHPDECIDCRVCVPEHPAEAIFRVPTPRQRCTGSNSTTNSQISGQTSWRRVKRSPMRTPGTACPTSPSSTSSRSRATLRRPARLSIRRRGSPAIGRPHSQATRGEVKECSARMHPSSMYARFRRLSATRRCERAGGRPLVCSRERLRPEATLLSTRGRIPQAVLLELPQERPDGLARRNRQTRQSGLNTLRTGAAGVASSPSDPERERKSP